MTIHLRSLAPRRATMRCVVLSVQGYRTAVHGFICKELGVAYPSSCLAVSYHFKPPNHAEVAPEEESYTMAHLHRIPFESGEIDYDRLPQILSHVTKNRRVYSKGLLECCFLAKFDIHAYNLEPYGCLSTRDLPEEEVWCQVADHSTNPYCAQRRVLKWARFILNKRNS